MERENFNTWTVNDLKKYLLQYDVTDIKGTGKNGRVIKKDLIYAANKIYNRKSVSFNELTQHMNLVDNNESYSKTLPEDIYQEVLYYLPINDIKSFCITHKYTCHNKLFWQNKFAIDNLPIIGDPTNFTEWIYEYNKVYDAVYESKAFMLYLKSEIRYIYIDAAPDNFNKLVPIFGNNYENIKVLQLFHANGKFSLGFFATTFASKLITKMDVDEAYGLKLLTYIFYLYPNVLITNPIYAPIRKKNHYKKMTKIWNDIDKQLG